MRRNWINLLDRVSQINFPARKPDLQAFKPKNTVWNSFMLKHFQLGVYAVLKVWVNFSLG